TLTGAAAGSYATPVIVLPTWALVGCLTKTSLHAPVPKVVRLLCAESSAKALPGGPLKSFDCLAAIVHAAFAGGWHGTETVIVKVLEVPGAMFRLRSLTNVPEAELPPSEGDTPMTVNPAGAVRLADPSDCVFAWFAMVRSMVVVEPPAR